MFPQQNYSNYNYNEMNYANNAMVPPYSGAPLGYGVGMPPMAPNGLSRSRTEITTTTTTTNIAPGMINQGYNQGYNQAYNQGFATSNVVPVMNGYETGMMNTMGGYGGYGATMVNSTVAPQIAAGYATTGYNTAGYVAPPVGMVTTNSNSRVLINGNGNSNSRVIIAPPIYNKAVITQRPVQSRVQYIPYQTKEIVYDTIEKRQVIPIQKTITEYQQLKHIETIPVEKTVTDFYAVEYLTEFMPTTTTEKVIDYVQQEVINETVNYRPVDTQRIIPNPNGLSTSGVNMAGASVCAPSGIVTPGPGAAFGGAGYGAAGYGAAGYGGAGYSQYNTYGQQNIGLTGPAVLTGSGVGSMVQSVNNVNPMNPMVQSINPMINSTYSTAYDPVSAELANGLKTQPLF